MGNFWTKIGLFFIKLRYITSFEKRFLEKLSAQFFLAVSSIDRLCDGVMTACDLWCQLVLREMGNRKKQKRKGKKSATGRTLESMCSCLTHCVAAVTVAWRGELFLFSLQKRRKKNKLFLKITFCKKRSKLGLFSTEFVTISSIVVILKFFISFLCSQASQDPQSQTARRRLTVAS